MSDWDIIIIGGGPAGLTAGIYASRARLRTLLIEKLMPGGLAASTDKVENYPGFPGGIAGAELTKRMEDQAREFGLEIVIEEVKSLTVKNKVKIVKTASAEYEAASVIIATGTQPKKLNVPGEDKFRGRGVSYCATCDGPFFKDKDIVVVGCGSSGIQEGIFLLRFAKQINFVEFLPYMTAEKILQERIQKESRTKFHFGHALTAINGEEAVASVTIKERKTGKEKTIEAQGVFIYVGLNPITEFLKDTVKLDDYGYIVVDENLETSISGVFAAGDVRTNSLRQISTATGDGTLAALMAEEYVEKLKWGQ
jgi:thioredoxin reductase (NADPH)